METYADAIVYEWPMIITQYYYFNAPNNTIINYVELNVDRVKLIKKIFPMNMPMHRLKQN